MLVDKTTVKKVKYRTEYEQTHPHRLAPCVEKQGENYQHGVFEFSVPSGKVAYQKQRQEHIQEEYIRKNQALTILYNIDTSIIPQECFFFNSEIHNIQKIYERILP